MLNAESCGSNSQFETRLQFALEVKDVLRQLVLSTRYGGQLNLEVTDYINKNLIRDLFRGIGLGGDGRGSLSDRRHPEN